MRYRRRWILATMSELFVFAICLHNLPEGLAIGVGYAASNVTHAVAANSPR